MWDFVFNLKVESVIWGKDSWLLSLIFRLSNTDTLGLVFEPTPTPKRLIVFNNLEMGNNIKYFLSRITYFAFKCAM